MGQKPKVWHLNHQSARKREERVWINIYWINIWRNSNCEVPILRKRHTHKSNVWRSWANTKKKKNNTNNLYQDISEENFWKINTKKHPWKQLEINEG